MEKLVSDLFNFTGRELNETAWAASLPIDPGIALHSFFEGFKDHGMIRIILNDSERLAKFKLFLHVGSKEQTFETSLSYDGILKGWKRGPIGSPHNLYDSIYQVYDQLGEEIKRQDRGFFFSDELDWDGKFRSVYPRKIREKMETHTKESFKRYHEGVLVPYPQKGRYQVGPPRIFAKVLKEFPLNWLSKAILAKEFDQEDDLHCGPCPEYIPEMSEENFDDNYFPSESALMDVFWGMYLKKLSDDKGYPTWDDDRSLKHFISRGDRALARLTPT